MATNSATVRYASRTAVYGSNAYDLSRIREHAPAPMPGEPKKAPVKKPAAQPVARPNSNTAGRSSAAAGRKAQKSYGISLFAVTGFVVVAVMLVFVLLAHIKYTEVTSETAQLQAQLTALTEEERRLKIAYENAFDVNAVEAYATNVLGMSQPTTSQLATVKATASDKAVIVNTEQDNTQVKESMGTFLASLLAYFK